MAHALAPTAPLKAQPHAATPFAGLAAPALAVRGLTHRYGETLALDAVDLAVPPGERFGLLGPNGGGKTTLFRIASTLLHPSEGSAQVFGHDVSADAGAVRRRIGVVFQHVALDAELTVRENLAIQAALVGLGRADRDQRIAETLEAFGLADRARTRVKALSGGLARRADLARGLLHRPDLLLLDEPTTGLDPLARRDLWDVLDALRRTGGTTQIVATHLMEEAERCDRVGILDRGRLVALGTPDELKAALGADALWLAGPDPEGLAEALQKGLGLDARIAGRSVLVVHPEPAGLLPEVYALPAVRIDEAAVRRPTLEDVFVATAGRPFGAVEG